MQVRDLTHVDALNIAGWRYLGRESTYDIAAVVSHKEGFHAIEHEGQLIGYCCFGAEARVPGVDEQEGLLDIGYGMRPDLVGRGLGRTFVGTILGFAVDTFTPTRLRLLILDWKSGPGGLTVEGVAVFEGPIARILDEQLKRLKSLEPMMRGSSSDDGPEPSP